MRQREQARARADLRQDRVEGLFSRQVAHGGDPHPGARGVQRAEQAEVLDVGRDDLVLGAEIESGEDDVARVRRRVRQRDVLHLGPDQRGNLRARAIA